MEVISVTLESGIDSELIDLGAVPLSVLRTLDNPTLRAAVRHVVEQTRYARVSSEHS